MAQAPHSRDAEASVVGAILAQPKVTGEVIASLLQAEHFYVPEYRALYDALVDAYFTDTRVDPLTLSKQTGELEAEEIRQLAVSAEPRDAASHAKIIKADADRRQLLEVAEHITHAALTADPEKLAAEVSQRAMEVATSTLLTNDIVSYEELGRRFVKRQHELQAAAAAGIEIGVHFDLHFLDDRLHGLKPTELMILAGEPGVGKSALAFAGAVKFAERQLRKPEEKRIGTLILSLEMGEDPTTDRLGQAEGQIDSAKLRDGSVTNDELAHIIKNWRRRKDIPLYFNFTSMLRASQARALISEAIRRYNVGLVVIDHMRYFNADERYDNAADEDEAKARFLKESIAKDLGCAVQLLAHTTKGIENRDDRRPKLSDLRGGGMVAAHADAVAFVYSTFRNADEEEVLEGRVARTDMELLWEKNRHGLTEPTLFTLDPSTMFIRDRI